MRAPWRSLAGVTRPAAPRRVVSVTLLAGTRGRMLAHLRGRAFFSEEPLACAR